MEQEIINLGLGRGKARNNGKRIDNKEITEKGLGISKQTQ